MTAQSKFTSLRKVVFACVLFAATGSLAAAEEKSKTFDFGAVLSHHLNDDVIFEFQIGGQKVRPGDARFDVDPAFLRRYSFRDSEGIYKWDGGLPMHITKRVMMIFICSFFLIVIFVGAARVIAANPYRVNGRFANFVETLVQFVRVDVVGANMHHHGKGFEVYILTLFFFVLFGNLFGLIPSLGEIAEVVQIAATGGHFGHHAEPGETVHLPVGLWPGITFTGDIGVTMPLAVLTTLMVWITGFRYQGFHFLWSFMPHGLPKVAWLFLYPLLFILELIIGPLAKGFALMMRLLANMTAGHVIILALLCFIFQFSSYFVAFAAVPGAMAIYLLEIFVAFLQAFLFALLTVIFVSGSMHSH